MKRAAWVTLWVAMGSVGTACAVSIRTTLDAPSDVGFISLVLVYLLVGLPSVALRLAIGGTEHLTAGLRTAETILLVAWNIALSGLFLAIVAGSCRSKTGHNDATNRSNT